MPTQSATTFNYLLSLVAEILLASRIPRRPTFEKIAITMCLAHVLLAMQCLLLARTNNWVINMLIEATTPVK